jgi:hypothetical protein
MAIDVAVVSIGIPRRHVEMWDGGQGRVPCAGGSASYEATVRPVVQLSIRRPARNQSRRDGAAARAKKGEN